MLKALAVAFRLPTTPSVRFRVRQLIPVLERDGIAVRVLYPSFIGARFPSLASRLFYCRLLARARRADVVWVQKIVLPPRVTRLLRRLNPALLFDFDDAIYTRHGSSLEYALASSRVVTAGNAVLAAHAKRFCSRVLEVPTSLDVDVYSPAPPKPPDAPFVVGWMGSAENLPYLDLVSEALASFCREQPGTVFRVVSNGTYRAEGLEVDNIAWSEQGEVSELRGFTIGLMPLPDDEWTRGKCASKAIQYMAVGIPVIASPVGMAKRVVDGATGILATTPSEWLTALRTLHGDAELRRAMGAAGRAKVEAEFSSEIIGRRMAEALREAASRSTRASRPPAG